MDTKSLCVGAVMGCGLTTLYHYSGRDLYKMYVNAFYRDGVLTYASIIFGCVFLVIGILILVDYVV